ncbi:ExbD/TolR family protein [Gemmata sp.]|uniref:ExbD/TolR family protein n=1 Tax=Gemmata sp. TaxID=1914242 RepID=UPI003F703A8C
MSAWHVRQQGSPAAVSVPDAGAVAEGLRDGNWLPTDEVRGPGDAAWQPIESHPTFAAVAEEVAPPSRATASDDHLDMNPLIDVCLVLLIFFILTITYASLERAIDVPPVEQDKKGPAPQVQLKDIRDRVFIVRATMDGEKPVVKIEKKDVPVDQIFNEMKQVIASTGRKEMVLDVDKDVPWGVLTAILDAAKGNGVFQITRNNRK